MNKKSIYSGVAALLIVSLAPGAFAEEGHTDRHENEAASGDQHQAGETKSAEERPHNGHSHEEEAKEEADKDKQSEKAPHAHDEPHEHGDGHDHEHEPVHQVP